MELIPLTSSPAVRMFFESKIQPIEAEHDGVLNMVVKVP